MKNKTATECWSISKSKLDSAIDRYVPMKKQQRLFSHLAGLSFLIFSFDFSHLG